MCSETKEKKSCGSGKIEAEMFQTQTLKNPSQTPINCFGLYFTVSSGTAASHRTSGFSLLPIKNNSLTASRWKVNALKVLNKKQQGGFE